MNRSYTDSVRRAAHALPRLVVAALLTAIPLAAVPARAQGDETPPDPQVEILKLQKEIAELQKAIAQAERTAFDASLPTSGASVAPLAGTTTVDANVKTESRILARMAAVKIADTVAKRAPGDAKVIVLHDPNLRDAAAALAQYRLAMDLIDDDYSMLPSRFDKPEDLDALAAASVTPGLAIDGASAFIKSAAGIVGLFRQNTTYTGQDVVISDAEFRAFVAASLREQKPMVVVIDPMLFFPGPVVKDSLTNSDVYTRMSTLMKARKDILTRLQVSARVKDDLTAAADETKKKVEGLKAKKVGAEAKLEDLEKERRAVPAGHKPSAALLKKIDETKTAIAEATDALPAAESAAKTAADRVKKYHPRIDLRREEWTRWLAAANAMVVAVSLPAKDSPGLLAILARTDALWFALQTDEGEPKGGYILDAKVPAAGGTYRTRQNLWTTLFTGDLLSYSGGANGYFVYLTTEGVIADAGEVHHISGFGKFKKLVKEGDGSNIDNVTPAAAAPRLPVRPKPVAANNP